MERWPAEHSILPSPSSTYIELSLIVQKGCVMLFFSLTLCEDVIFCKYSAVHIREICQVYFPLKHRQDRSSSYQSKLKQWVSQPAIICPILLWLLQIPFLQKRYKRLPVKVKCSSNISDFRIYFFNTLPSRKMYIQGVFRFGFLK